MMLRNLTKTELEAIFREMEKRNRKRYYSQK